MSIWFVICRIAVSLKFVNPLLAIVLLNDFLLLRNHALKMCLFAMQGVLYGSVGFVCGIIGQGIANTIMTAKRYVEFYTAYHLLFLKSLTLLLIYLLILYFSKWLNVT